MMRRNINTLVPGTFMAPLRNKVKMFLLAPNIPIFPSPHKRHLKHAKVSENKKCSD
jgi:hypothetical protein